MKSEILIKSTTKEEDIKQTDNETKDSLKNKTTEQSEKDTTKKDNTEITKTKQKKPQYVGLKIYPPKKKKAKKASCDNTPGKYCHGGGGTHGWHKNRERN